MLLHNVHQMASKKRLFILYAIIKAFIVIVDVSLATETTFCQQAEKLCEIENTMKLKLDYLTNAVMKQEPEYTVETLHLGTALSHSHE